MKLAIFIQHHTVACFGCDATGVWTRQRIKGESALDIKPGKAAVLQPILKELSDRLNFESALRGVEVHLIYAQAEEAVVADTPRALADLQCNTWQILRMEPLLERAAMARGVTPEEPLKDDKWLNSVLLPILTSTFTYSNQAFQVEEARARQVHEDTMESLRADVQAKLQEVARLQARINALQLPGVELLFAFLPAIYRNFWGVIRPDELALLAGTLTVPDIPSPYPDHSPDTVLMLKRRFLNLPDHDRERVLSFCRDLPHRLDVRMEMRDLFGEI